MNKKEVYKLAWDFATLTSGDIMDFIDWLYNEGFEIANRKITPGVLIGNFRGEHR